MYQTVHGDQSVDLDSLHRLINEGYDMQMRPFVDGPPVNVSVGMMITSIHSISDISMDFGVTMFLVENWEDPRLIFNGTDPVDLRSGSELLAKIWTPDLYYVNVKEGYLHQVTTTNKQLRVSPGGHVTYDIRVSLTLICYMSLHRFPMDRQSCGIDMESFGYTTKDVRLSWNNDIGVMIPPDVVMPGFEIESPTIEQTEILYPMGYYDRLECRYSLHRELIFYIMEHYVPSMLLVILSWISFWLSVDATPARASLGITTVLTLTTLSSGARVELPKVSYTKAIDVWMLVCSFYVFAALLEFAIASYYHKYKRCESISLSALEDAVHLMKETSFTKMGPTIVNQNRQFSNDCFSMTNGNVLEHNYNYMNLDTRVQMPQNDTIGNVTDAEQERVKYENIAKNIDRYSRILFPATFVLYNCVYWPMYLKDYWLIR
ncbi:glycine receptor subunit alpha-1-like [Saccoglossus kowalevskii]